MTTTGGSAVPAVVRLLVGAVAASAVLTWLGAPSAVLFGSLLAAMVHALWSARSLEVPPLPFRVAQALIGAVIGTQISGPAVRRMVDDAPVLVLVTVVTVGFSVVAGLLLARRRDVSAVTGVYSLIAGGASGVVAVARELGADDRVVTVVQFLRVVIVLISLPLVTAAVFHPPAGRGSLDLGGAGAWHDLGYTAAAVVGGLVLARLVPITTMALLGPLAVGAVVAATGVVGDVVVPTPLQWLAFGGIGLQVGLRFTRDSLASIARMLPAVLALILLLMVVTGALAAALARFTSVDGLTAYLATTPGGLFAVLATAVDGGADVTYVMALQLFRLVVVLALVPLLARWLRPRP